MRRVAAFAFFLSLCPCAVIAGGIAGGEEYLCFYGDIHSHTGFSDGVEGSTPADAYAHARDVAHLDFYAVTDHKYPSAECGPQDWPLTPEEYELVKAQADAANQDGVFVTLYGYEWTIAGGAPHGNVYMAADFIATCVTETFYEDLFYRRLANRKVFGHFNHPAMDGGWGDLAFSSMGAWCMRLMEARGDFPPALNRAELTGEIAEYAKAIEKGWLVGVDGSKDTHGDNWGQFGPDTWQQYNTVALATGLTREEILEALQMRRTYVSKDTDFTANPLEVELRASKDGGATYPYVMGEALDAEGVSSVVLRLTAREGGTDYLDEIRIYKNGDAVAMETGVHSLDHTLTYTDTNPAHGDYYFAFVIEEDGEVALTSSIFVRNGDTDSDGLGDEDEINNIGTNPNYPDTDGDGFSDGDEVAAGTDPLNPNDHPIQATPTPTETPTIIPTPTPTPPLAIILAPNKTVVSKGDLFELDVVVSERISDMGKLVIYALIQTPGKALLSFVLGKDGTFTMEPGIKPATTVSAIPPLTLPLCRERLTNSLARGDYRFAIGIFHAGDGITLADWRSKAIYWSEAIVTLQ